MLVFWLVWWAWTQFAWTLNAVDTTHHGVGLSPLWPPREVSLAHTAARVWSLASLGGLVAVLERRADRPLVDVSE
ncbi:hypothetical protein BSZ35_17850 [Salinibacter sp. 10B]|nr:hypothetical protein BSZ35_17850 [Salinibacter sp. 10B]